MKKKMNSYGLYLILIAAITFIYMYTSRKNISRFMLEICALDTMDILSRQSFTGLYMVIISYFFIALTLKPEFREMYVISYKNRIQIWNGQCIFALKICFETVFISDLLGIIYNISCGDKFVNWGKAESYFYFLTRHIISNEIEVAGVVIAAILLDTMVIYSAILSALLIYWKTKELIVPSILLAAVGIWDGYINYMGKSLYYKKIRFSFSKIYDSQAMCTKIFIVMALVVTMYLLGRKVAARREFL